MIRVFGNHKTFGGKPPPIVHSEASHMPLKNIAQRIMDREPIVRRVEFPAHRHFAKPRTQNDEITSLFVSSHTELRRLINIKIQRLAKRRQERHHMDVEGRRIVMLLRLVHDMNTIDCFIVIFEFINNIALFAVPTNVTDDLLRLRFWIDCHAERRTTTSRSKSIFVATISFVKGQVEGFHCTERLPLEIPKYPKNPKSA